MQPAALGKAQRLGPGKGGLAGSARRRGGGNIRRAPLAVRAAAAEEASDLSSLFRDALSTPAVKKVAAPPAAAPPAAAPPPPPPTTAAAVSSPLPGDMTVDSVPGTEILQSAPQPQPAPAATQGIDFVLEQLQAKPPGYGDKGGTAAAAKAAKSAAAPIGDALTDSLNGGLPSAGKGLTSAADSMGDALGGAAGALSGAASGVGDAAAGASAAAAAAASQAADTLTSALTGVTGGLTGAADGLASGLTGAASGAVDGVRSSAQQFLDAAAAEASTEAAAALAAFESLVGGLTSTVEGTTSAVSSTVSSQVAGVTNQLSGAVSGVVDQAASVLPPGATDVLVAASGIAAGAARQLSALDPTQAAVAAGVSLGVPAVLAWRAANGGFEGTLEPEDALEVLQTEAAVLVDVRTEQQRVERGVAELRRGALGKGAAVPPVQLLPSVAKRLRDPSGVALEIQALEVAALSKIRPNATKVIVMDDKGDSAKRVARALRAAGVSRPYVLAGGFKAWQAAGLGVRTTTSEYDASPLDAVEDVAGTVVEQAASQLSPLLREPSVAAGAVGVLGGLAYLAVNYHTTLQFIGVLGLELTIISRALSYESVGEALKDVQALAGRASSLASLPGKAAEAAARAGRGVVSSAQQATGESKSV